MRLINASQLDSLSYYYIMNSCFHVIISTGILESNSLSLSIPSIVINNEKINSICSFGTRLQCGGIHCHQVYLMISLFFCNDLL